MSGGPDLPNRTVCVSGGEHCAQAAPSDTIPHPTFRKEMGERDETIAESSFSASIVGRGLGTRIWVLEGSS